MLLPSPVWPARGARESGAGAEKEKEMKHYSLGVVDGPFPSS